MLPSLHHAESLHIPAIPECFTSGPALAQTSPSVCLNNNQHLYSESALYRAWCLHRAICLELLEFQDRSCAFGPAGEPGRFFLAITRIPGLFCSKAKQELGTSSPAPWWSCLNAREGNPGIRRALCSSFWFLSLLRRGKCFI